MTRKDTTEGILGSPIPEKYLSKQRKGFFGWLWSTSLRLTIYYCVYLAIFTCPLTQSWPKDTSPDAQSDPNGLKQSDCYTNTLCNVIHKGFDTVEPILSPYISPYYTKYAQTYVDYSLEKAQPAVSRLWDGYDVVKPKVQDLGKVAVDKAQPYTDLVQSKAAPYIAKVREHNHKYVAPLSEKAQQAYEKIYDDFYVPFSEKSAPYLAQTQEYLVTTVAPATKHHLAVGYELVKRYLAQLYLLLDTHVLSKLFVAYNETVEPHVSNIYSRVIENQAKTAISTVSTPTITTEADTIAATLVQQTEAVYSIQPVGEPEVYVDGDAPVEEEQVLSILPVGEPEVAQEGYPTDKEQQDDASILPVGEPEVVEDADLENAASILPVGEPVIVEQDVTPTPTPTPTATPSSTPKESQEKTARMETELKYWKGMIQHTVNEAFTSFLDECEDKKQKISTEARPRITELLQELQRTQTQILRDLTKLVNKIPTGLEEDGSEEAAEKDYSITTDVIQEEFRVRADQLRSGAMSVREYCLEVAQKAVDQTEASRVSTLAVLDDFAELTISEVGRNLVKINSKFGAKTMPNWNDWQEFNELKDKIFNGRQELIDHEVNMADINQLLKEAQDTANYLVSETAKVMSGLKGKSSFVIQQQLVNKQKKLEAQGASVDDELPEDAIIYEELEEEEEKVEDVPTASSSVVADASEETGLGSDADYKEEEEVDRITTTSTLIRYETIQKSELKPSSSADYESASESEPESEELSPEPDHIIHSDL